MRYQTFKPHDTALNEALQPFDCDARAIGAPLKNLHPVVEILVTADGWVEVYDLPEGRRYVPAVWGGWGALTADLDEALKQAGQPDE